MSEDSLNLLLARLDTLLAESRSLPFFELQKTSQIVEHAQKLLLKLEMEDPATRPRHGQQRELIRTLLERLADRQDDFEHARLEAEEAARRVQQEQEEAAAAVQRQKQQQQQVNKSGPKRSTLSTQEHILQDHRNEQESLTDDLLNMAQTLRQRQTAFGKAITADNDLIDKTGEALNRNADRMKTTGGRLGQYAKKSSSTTCLSLVAIFVAMLGVVFMIGVIKVT